MAAADKDPCKPDAGRWAPRIDRERCEAKADCVAVCPFDVFQIGKLSDAERAALSLRGKIRAFFHGGKQAFAVRAADCHGCGLCVKACPEKAIKLEAVR
jgi:NAD-dependent dihydropyrimidine dehydrogenase PreA subunit